MRKLFGLCLLLGLVSFPCLQANELLIKAESAYYSPTGRTFRTLYSEIYQTNLEISAQVGQNLYPFFSTGFSTKRGQSALGDHTKLTFLPIGIGLQYLWRTSQGDLYLGAGALPTYVTILNDSPYVEREICKWGCGALVKGGALFNLSSTLFLELFAAYSYIRIPYHNNRGDSVTPRAIDLSGASCGIGFGYRFK